MYCTDRLRRARTTLEAKLIEQNIRSLLPPPLCMISLIVIISPSESWQAVTGN